MLRLRAGLCLAGFVLGACSSSGDLGTDSGPVRDLSPLEEFLGAGRGSIIENFGVGRGGSGLASEDERQAAVQSEVQRQERLAECMREQGFEYVPRSAEWIDERYFAHERQLDKAYALGLAEFVELYGYGIVLTSFRSSGAEETENPNELIRESLSSKGQEEYREAYTGGADGGCQSQTAGEVPDLEDEFMGFSGLHSDMGALQQRIYNDPRLQDAWQRWSDCMAERGHSGLGHHDDAMNSVFFRTGEVDGDDIDSVEELRDYERNVATADLACQQEEGYAELYREVAFELEEQFIEDHRAELEQYRDWLAENDL